MEVKLFGFTLLKTNEETKELKSFVPQESANDDGNLTVSSNFYSTSLNLDGAAKSDAELINRYRDMSIHPEVEIAIDDIVSEAIVNEADENPVKILTKNLDLADGIKTKISKEFENVLSMLNFNRAGYDVFKSWYVDGRIYYHIIIDPKKPKDGIKELRKIDPRKIKKVKQVQKGLDKNRTELVEGVKEYYLYNEKGLGTTDKQSGIPISIDSISHVTSGLKDSRKNHVIGHLHKAIKACNQLQMVEDSVVIYRWTRAPERRVFYIDVGNLPKLKAEQYIGDIMNKYKNKVAYDASTGEVKDDKRHMSMLEDFWFPRREGGRGTEIETLPGGSNLGEMDDVIYFQKKLYKSLNVPISRLEQDAGMQLGRATEISRDEYKFYRFIVRLRNQFNQLFLDLLKKQLILKEIITPDEWTSISQNIIFDFTQDSYHAEVKNQEMLIGRIDLLSNMTDYVGKYYSNKWIMTNLLKFSEEEVNAMKKEITTEKKDPIFKPSEEDEEGGFR
jgi:hypothetical protein